MNYTDLINGSVELIGAIFLCVNIKELHLAKEIRGVSVLPTIFFALWGVWNLYFYSFNDFMWSFMGGLAIVLAEFIWLVQAVYYSGHFLPKWGYKK